MKIFILYPNQLFKNLSNFKNKKVLLIEDPLFFTQYKNEEIFIYEFFRLVHKMYAYARFEEHEDDKLISTKIKTILEKFFNCVIIASNGEEAIKVFKSDKIDLIISDINMPKMDGLEFLEILRNINSQVPFIFVTARDEPDMMLKAIQLDINNYILKPIDLKNFLFVIDKAIEKLYNNYLKLEEINKIQLNDNIFWNKETKILTKDNISFKLTKKEILLIELLLESNNKIYPVQEIITYLWDEDYQSKDYIACLKNLISRLRNKIPQINIENIYGMGYKIKLSN